MAEDIIRRVAILKVSEKLLRDALHLPNGTIIRDIRMGGDYGVFEFRITSPDLPEKNEGEPIKVVNLIFTTVSSPPVITESRWSPTWPQTSNS